MSASNGMLGAPPEDVGSAFSFGVPTQQAPADRYSFHSPLLVLAEIAVASALL